MQKFGQPVNFGPRFSRPDLRAKLIIEEALETAAGIVGSATAHQLAVDEISKQLYEKPVRPRDMAETADGLCDLIYVALGCAVEFGIDLAPLFEEVHRTNMAKEGGATRPDGKILKPAGWQKPRIAELLREQGWED